MDNNWMEFKCKSGQTLFLYNKVTGEHKWPSINCSADEDHAMIGQPIICKELSNASTQTDDNGCINGCTSKCINTNSSIHSIKTLDTSDQQGSIVLHEVDCGFDIKDDCRWREENTIDVMVKVLEEDFANTTAGDNNEGMHNTGCHENRNNQLDVRNSNSTMAGNCIVESKDHILNMEEQKDKNGIKHVGELTLQGICEAIETVQVKEVFECHYCKQAFNLKSDLEDHIKLHDGKSRYECVYCDRKFSRNNKLVRHVRTHTGEKPFGCSYCEKKFAQNNDLKRHVRTHTGEKPFKCSFCQKGFAQKNDLICHVRLHTGEKPFECSYCKKKCAQKSNLREHLKIHTGEKPYKCSYCKKAFAFKVNLQVHLKNHTGQKPFECSYCNKKFVRKYFLDRHLRTHTGEKPFECSFCDKKYNSKTNLRIHMQRHEEGKI